MERSTKLVCTFCYLTLALARAAEVDYEKVTAEAVKAGKAADVNRLCRQWAAADPGNEKPRIILGRTLLKAGLAERAIEQFELAAEANPLSPAPPCEMGLLFLEEKRLDLSAKEFAEALRIDPRHLPAEIGKVRLELSRGDAPGALLTARSALDGHPESADARALLADCLVALGDTDEALAELAEAIEAAPENADVCYSLASALEMADRAEDAQQAWRRFLQVEPGGERAERVRNGRSVLQTRVLQTPFVGYGGCSAVSPDGKHVACTVSHRGIHRAPLTGRGEPTLVQPCPEGGGQRWTAWSPDGTTLLYADYTPGPERQHRVRRVAAVPDQAPPSVDFTSRLGTGQPAWSPSGREILFVDADAIKLCLLDLSTDQLRSFWPSSQVAGLKFNAVVNYMPTGKELVILGKTGSESKGLYRISIGTEQMPVKLFECQGSGFGVPVVSEDGTAVAVILYGKPSHLAVAATSPPSRLTRLCEAYYASKPSWHPEGRALLARVEGRLSVVRLGGLDCRPVRIAAERQANALSVIVTSQAEAPQQVALRWEAFDDQSLRIGLGEAEDGPLDVKPKEKAEWSLELDPTVAEKAETIKVRALNEDGRGAVNLVDWQE